LARFPGPPPLWVSNPRQTHGKRGLGKRDPVPMDFCALRPVLRNHARHGRLTRRERWLDDSWTETVRWYSNGQVVNRAGLEYVYEPPRTRTLTRDAKNNSYFLCQFSKETLYISQLPPADMPGRREVPRHNTLTSAPT